MFTKFRIPFAALAAISLSLIGAPGAAMAAERQSNDLSASFDSAFGTKIREPQTFEAVYADDFERRIVQLADGDRGRIGVYAIDLETGKEISVLGDQRFPMASTSKVAVNRDHVFIVRPVAHKLGHGHSLLVVNNHTLHKLYVGLRVFGGGKLGRLLRAQCLAGLTRSARLNDGRALRECKTRAAEQHSGEDRTRGANGGIGGVHESPEVKRLIAYSAAHCSTVKPSWEGIDQLHFGTDSLLRCSKTSALLVLRAESGRALRTFRRMRRNECLPRRIKASRIPILSYWQPSSE